MDYDKEKLVTRLSAQKKVIIFTLLFLLIGFLTIYVAHPASKDIVITPEEIGQGDIGLLKLNDNNKSGLEIVWNERNITLMPGSETGSYVAFLGVDLTLKPGRYMVKKTDGKTIQTKVIDVYKKDYGIRRLTIPKSMEALDKKTLNRVRDESRRIKRLFLESDKKPLWEGPWIKPVKGPVVSPFGRRSIINGTERSPHSGVDFKASEGEPVMATNSGIVVFIEECFFSGLTVIIEHGGGIQSMYFHLSKVLADIGQTVKKGEIIGLSGCSGRVTGPHLHFGVRLDGARVNPLKLIDLSRAMGG